jgi:outer membrane protein
MIRGRQTAITRGGCSATIFLALIAWIFSIPSVSSGALLTLQEGLRIATGNNRLIKIAEREEMISRADALILRAKLLPEVNASAGGTALAYQPAAIFGAETVPVSQENFLAYSLSIQQTLYDFKKNASLYEEGKVILGTKKIDTRRIRNLVALEFGLTYFDLLESEKMLKVAEQEVERLESHLRDAKNMYEEGVITKNDLLQAEVRISDAKQRLSTAKSLRSITTSRLNNILVRPLNSQIEVSDAYLKDLKGLPEDLATLDSASAWKAAEKQRPELLIADETLRALNLRERARKAEYFPKLFVQGGYDYTENRYMVHDGNWSVTLGLSVNLYSGGSTKAEIMKVEGQKSKLLEEKNNLIDQIKLELEKYILDSRTARERVAVTKDAVSQAEENLRINKVKYEEGVGTATDVLDAVTLLTVAETNYYKAVYDVSRAEAAVLYSMGVDLAEVYK